MSGIDFSHLRRGTGAACPCGCGLEHVRSSGSVSRADGHEILLSVVMAAHRDERHLWLAIGSGPLDGRDLRDCLAIVEVWATPEGLASRVADLGSSPFAGNPVFADPRVRVVERDEALAFEDYRRWLFQWVDDLAAQLPGAGDFLLAGIKAQRDIDG